MIRRDEKLKKYLELLLKWNSKFNLTAITDEEKVWSNHFEDSLAPIKFVEGKKRLADLGSGAGFPGLPLKIALPDLEVVLIDSRRKRISFCNEIIRELKLDNVRAVHGRAEDKNLYSSLMPFDVVISRATWALDEYLRIADPYYDKNGICIAMRGAAWEDELSSAKLVMGSLGLKLFAKELYSIGDSEKRCLLVFKKSSR